MRQLQQLIIMCAFMFLWVSSVFATVITADGFDVDSNKTIDSSTEFNIVSAFINVDFTENSLTLSNAKDAYALWWLNYGDYTFSGFGNITNVYIESNNKFYGSVVNDYSFDNDSITLDMSNGWFLHSSGNDQSLVFHIERELVAPAAVPEPTTLMLFGAGLVGLGICCRRK